MFLSFLRKSTVNLLSTLFKKGYEATYLSLQACRQAGFTPSIAYTGKRAENIIDLVSKGMGISLLMAKPISYINT